MSICPRGDFGVIETRNVKVFCRIRANFTKGNSCIELVDDCTLKISGSRGGVQKEVPQCTVFEEVVLPLVSDLVEGKNGLFFTYGVTGSGKTYSMVGDNKDPGMLPRVLDVLFNSVDQHQTRKCVVKSDSTNGFDIQPECDAMIDRHKYDNEHRQRFSRFDMFQTWSVKRPRESVAIEPPMKAMFAVFISLVEVYNNNIYDLLQDTSDAYGKNLSPRFLREDTRRNVYVSGVTEVEVKSVDEALSVFSYGLKRRRVGKTALNAESSRGHCVFTIRLVRTGFDAKYSEVIQDKNLFVVSQLCLVDLAGSERSSRSGTQGSRLKEASNINNSLMNLRKCIEVLRENQLPVTSGQGRVVPYRDTRLTYLFKNFFEGDGYVVMLVCVHSSTEDYEETMHVLKFAETSQDVSTHCTPKYPLRSLCNLAEPTSTRRNTHARPINLSADVLNVADSSSFDDLNNFSLQIDNCIDGLFNKHLTKTMDIEKLEMLNDLANDSDENTVTGRPVILQPTASNPSMSDMDQDSAPEQDHYSGSFEQLNFAASSYLIDELVDTTLLRALINKKIDCKQQAYEVFSTVLFDLRAHMTKMASSNLVETDNAELESGQSRQQKLESRIRHLEGKISEKSATIEHERLNRIKDVEHWRLEASRLQRKVDVLTHCAKKERLSTKQQLNSTKKPSLRPSMSHPNLVSVLSKQWESRLAQQKADAERSRRPCAVATEPKSSQKRAAFNPRHRRSRSVGGDKSRWLEHQEVNSVPLGTVFSPTLKRQKSVTKLEFKDTLKADNYVLHHQETDTCGNVETKLYKGPIIPTVGGGSAVIFNDVEVLHQMSPTSDQKRCERDPPIATIDEVNIYDNELQPSIKRPHFDENSIPQICHKDSISSNQSDNQSCDSSTYCPIEPPRHLVPMLKRGFHDFTIEGDSTEFKRKLRK